ncbi:penicillin-binding transpeptidase domain-containing protein [Novosphingobium panipatense]
MTQARRQPGSTFKLFVYLAALKAGMEPQDTISNAPIESGSYKPQNAGGHTPPPSLLRTPSHGPAMSRRCDCSTGLATKPSSISRGGWVSHRRCPRVIPVWRSARPR